jgi:hypothetical protein
MRVSGRLTGVLSLLALLGLSLLVGLAQDVTICPRGQSFWVSNPGNWTVTTLTIGGQVYTQDELLEIFASDDDADDASELLLLQVAAAKLNAANGVISPLGEALIQQADTLLLDLAGRAPLNIDPASPEGQQLIVVVDTLTNFNSGALVIGCPVEDPEATPEVTQQPEATPVPESTAEATPEATAQPGDDLPVIIIIEGPVQTVNVNIITIYNINIEVDPNDPILTVIKVGDMLRIQGDLASSGTTLVLVAINITIVNVEVFISVDGQVYRDDSDCGNAPPDWAPANGWRRRCQGGGGGNNGGGGGKGSGKGSTKSS